MKKRLFAFALILAMLMAVMAGCSGTTGTTESTQEETPAVEEPTASQEAEQAEAPQQEAAAEPEEEPEEPSIYPFDEAQTLTCWTAFQSQLTSIVSGYSSWPVFDKIEELTNVHIEWTEVAQSTSSESFNLMVAGGDYCDMGRGVSGMYSGGAGKGYEDGVFMDMTEYIENYMPNYNNVIDNSVWGGEYVRGKLVDQETGMYFYVNTIADASYVMNGTSMRGDWLEEQGLSVPTTIEELENVMEVFKTEYDLDNVLMVNSENYNTLFTASLNFTTDYYCRDGEVIYGYTTDEYRELMTRMNDWYNRGFFDSGFITRTGNPKDADTLELIATGGTGVFETSVTIWSTLFDSTNDPDFDLAAVPVIVDPEDGQQHFQDLGQIGSGTVSFFADNQHPEICAQWLDFLYTDYASDLMAYGIEGESFTYDESGKPQWNMDKLNEMAEANGYSASTIAEFYYGIKGNFVTLSQQDALWAFYDDAQIEAIGMFGDQSNWGDYWGLDVTLTTEENTTISTVNTDIRTFISEQSMKFITGETDITSDAAWESFKQGIADLGQQTVQEIYEAAYQRTL